MTLSRLWIFPALFVAAACSGSGEDAPAHPGAEAPAEHDPLAMPSPARALETPPDDWRVPKKTPHAIAPSGCGTTASFTQPPGTLLPRSWVRTGGGPMGQAAPLFGIDARGDIVASGTFSGTLGFGAGHTLSEHGPSFVAKLSSAGTPLWSRLLRREGLVARELPSLVGVLPDDGGVLLAGELGGQVDFGNGVVVGYPDDVANGVFNHTAFLLKLDANGEPAWARPLPDVPKLFALDSNGALFLGGQLAKTASFGGAPLSGNFFLAKIDAGGHLVFSQAFGSPETTHHLQSLAVTPEGDLIAAGHYAQAMDLGGAVLPPTGPVTIFVARFRGSDAKYVESNYFGPQRPPPQRGGWRYQGEQMTASGTSGQAVGFPPDGHMVLRTNGHLTSHHAFVDGPATITVRAAGELLDGIGPHIVVTVGGVEVGSTYVNETSFTEKSFFFDATAGAHEIRVTYDNDAARGPLNRNLLVDWVGVPGCNGTAPNYLCSPTDLSAAVDCAGNVMLAGTFVGTLTLGETRLAANSFGSADAFVAKLGPSLKPLWARSFAGAPGIVEDPMAGGGQIPQALAIDADGNAVVAGRFTGSIVLGATTLFGPSTSLAEASFFVTKLSADGTPLFSHSAPAGFVGASIGIDAARNIYLAGDWNPGAPAQAHALVTKITP